MTAMRELTCARFSELIGDEFQLETTADPVTVELVQATDLSARDPNRGQHVRSDPFSLLFRAKGDFGLQQGLYKIQHDQLGQIELFLVPIGLDEQRRMRFEAVFN